jgi:hypothetical protein
MRYLLQIFSHRRRADNPRQRQAEVDEPPDDFREIQIFPQTADMQVNPEYVVKILYKHYMEYDKYMHASFFW